ncbi:hypothetical protein THAOC_01446 [Thalassiosira oceanica]|uniref:Uncharacterized protein n=1 Tax=Thalassiosira oceanica TaxID=159749 RepID=K0TN29_THAOC|nr:hypothetical protein THAOC_01446 [Thalassiosira oceanica]|eukprot:EJK76776.1 hypothetical protein THAOC_01446 [Thalassiosira oceanica]
MYDLLNEPAVRRTRRRSPDSSGWSMVDSPPQMDSPDATEDGSSDGWYLSSSLPVGGAVSPHRVPGRQLNTSQANARNPARRRRPVPIRIGAGAHRVASYGKRVRLPRLGMGTELPKGVAPEGDGVAVADVLLVLAVKRRRPPDAAARRVLRKAADHEPVLGDSGFFTYGTRERLFGGCFFNEPQRSI